MKGLPSYKQEVRGSSPRPPTNPSQKTKNLPAFAGPTSGRSAQKSQLKSVDSAQPECNRSLVAFPKPLTWKQYLLWLWKHDPQRYREPVRPVMVAPMERPKAKVTEPVQEKFL